jgi:hypothetical protein
MIIIIAAAAEFEYYVLASHFHKLCGFDRIDVLLLLFALLLPIPVAA